MGSQLRMSVPVLVFHYHVESEQMLKWCLYLLRSFSDGQRIGQVKKGCFFLELSFVDNVLKRLDSCRCDFALHVFAFM